MPAGKLKSRAQLLQEISALEQQVEKLTDRTNSSELKRRSEDRLSMPFNNSKFILKYVLDHIPVHVFWKDRNGVFLGANKRFIEDAGLKTSDDIVGKTDFDMPWKNFAEKLRSDDRRVMDSNVAAIGNVEKHVMADQSEKWVETNKIPLSNFEGTVVGVLGTFQDITERIIDQDLLRENQNRFRDFAKSAADRFWETDIEFRYTYLTPATGSLTRSTDSLLGLKPWEVEGSESNDWDVVKDCFTKRKAIRDFHYVWNGDDGVPRHLEITAIPYFDEDEGFLGYRGTTINETEKVNSKLQTATLQQRFYDAMESLDIGFILWDADDRFVTCNSYFMDLHRDNAKFLKSGIKFEDYIRKVVENGRIVGAIGNVEAWISEQLELRNKDLTEHEDEHQNGRTYRIKMQRIEDGSLIAFHIDVTESKVAERRLRDALTQADIANRSKTEFLANMSHELRTPLNAIIGFSDALSHGILGDLNNDKHSEYVGHINDSGAHLLRLINDILDVSAIEAGEFEINESEIDLKDLAEASTTMILPRAQEKKIKIINNIDNRAPEIVADALRLKQALVNVLSNAVKFTPEKGEIKVSFEVLDSGVMEIGVEDTGVGMDAEGIETALRRFGKSLQATGVDSNEGTGLGLPLAKAMMEAHGGTLAITSKKNQGTKVILRVPANRIVEKNISNRPV